jgi:hypothetical protein
MKPSQETPQSEAGQGIVEYALILVLVAVVLVVIGAILVKPAPPAPLPPTPPAFSAPLLEVVRWCEGGARDTYTTTSTSLVAVGNALVPAVQTQTHLKDSPEKFLLCMRLYEYQVTRG